MSCGAETQSSTKVEAARLLGEDLGITRDDDVVRAQPQPVRDLALRRGEQHDVGAERARQLHAHIAETAEPDDADGLARLDLPVTQRRPGGDAGAQQRREPRPARSFAARAARTPRRRRWRSSSRRTSACASRARSRYRCRWASSTQYCSSPALQLVHLRHESTMQPTAARSPSFTLVTCAPARTTRPTTLVAGHHRVRGALPLIARLVQVGVADPQYRSR